jgi:anti-sigma B factor antagonist
MRDFHLETVGVTGDHAVLRITGEIDVYTAPDLRQEVIDLATKGVVHLIVDLSGVVFLDSTALGALVGCLKRLRSQGGSLTLVITTERVMRVFRITGLIKAMPPHASIADAIAAEPHWVRTVEADAGGVQEWCERHGLTS